MDSTSEFDYICRTTAVDMFGKLEEEKKVKVINELRLWISAAKQSSKNNFAEIEGYTNAKLIEKVMNSVDYVISNENRYKIMALIMREFEGNDSIYNENFASDYKNALIKPRNDLAHKKLIYCNSNKKIIAIKKRQNIECNEECELCSKQYGVDECNEIRKKIFEYYQIFSETEKKVDNILKQSEMLHV